MPVRSRSFKKQSFLQASAFAVICFTTPLSAQENSGVDEIIVEAQRRSENIQDVPIAISALSEQTLQDAGVGDIEEVFNLLPGVDFEGVGTTNQSNIFIRGVGTSLFDGGVEHSVGVYIDDVYQGGQQGFNVALFDLASVEVLRGPQGTLYGKNALGGAIRFTTVKPQEDASLYLEGNYGNYDYYEIRAVANAPIIEDKVLFRLTGAYKQRDGLVENPLGEDLGTTDSIGARAQLRLLPTDTLTVDLTLSYSHDEPTIREGDFPDTIETRTAAREEQLVEDRDTWGVHAAIVKDFGPVSLTSISAYQGWEIDTIPIGDVVNAPSLTEQDIRFDQYSQEFRLASTNESALQWVAGVHYYHEVSDFVVPFQLVTLAGLFGYPDLYSETSFADLETDTYAAFADATYSVTDRLDLTIGGRFSYEEKEMAYRHESNVPDMDFQTFIDMTYGAGSGLTPDLFRFAPLLAADVEDDYSDFSPRFVVSYDLADSVMGYASVSRGFKSGGFNALFVAMSSQLAFDPESAWNYELGLKSTLFDNRLRFNVAGYYFDWKDLQARSVVLSAGGTSFALLINNAPETVTKGVDVEIEAALADGLDLGAAYSFIDATFEEFPDSPNGDISGNRLPFISKHNFKTYLSYRKPVSDNLFGFARLDYAYRTSYEVDNDNTAFLQSPARGLLDGRIGLETDRFEFSIWAKNIFDKKYHTWGEPSLTGVEGRIGEPRTFGVRASAKL